MMTVDAVLAGGFGGLCAAFISQPFDTLKVRSQLGLGFSLKGLYRGLYAQIGIQVFSNSLLFGLYGALKGTLGDPISAAMLAGAVEGVAYGPMELIKTRRQAFMDPPKWSEFGRGLGTCSIRESIGNCFYFGAYEFMRKKTASLSENTSILMSGGFAGCMYWIGIYPIDTIRVRIQGNKPLWGNLYKGLFPCLLRAFPVNCATFWGYEVALSYLKGNRSESANG